ncbi:hypothetical protein QFZ24_009934 [Streptomyces phaeochromogenes]|uniref:hypothetical protein n=1 Tax=Streptomyces phaeochromogenes TaxID=1923 RepID=UPI00278ECC25|nr:hypothetical protein [Streptomyces phaeochromogenes]MDQ0955925.1 hypothetical protein [Streptomyces phaeochromogenes]
MTPDQVVRAVDYIEAVWGGDSEAMERLDGFAPGELPTPFLLVEFLKLMVTSAGIVEATSDNAPPQERQDLAAAVSGVLVRAMQEWAQGAEPDLPEDGSPELPRDHSHVSEGIARTIASYLLATTSGTPGDLSPRLDAFRTVVAAMPDTE